MKKLYILIVTLLSGAGVMAASGDALTQKLTAPRTLLKAVDMGKYDVKNPRKAALKTAAKAGADAPVRLLTPRMERQDRRRRSTRWSVHTALRASLTACKSSSSTATDGP